MGSYHDDYKMPWEWRHEWAFKWRYYKLLSAKPEQYVLHIHAYYYHLITR
jgi:hypothetical protein